MKVVMRWAMMKVGLVMKMTKHIGPVGKFHAPSVKQKAAKVY